MKFNDYMFLSSDIECSEADVAILFGGYKMIPDRADETLKLYKNGIIKRIIVSGGIGYLNTDKKVCEADKLFNYLIENCVLESDIIKENKSKNTYQNILYSFNILSSNDLNKLKILLITSDFHMKRCLYLAKKIFQTSEIYTHSVRHKERTQKRMLYQEVFLLFLTHLKK